MATVATIADTTIVGDNEDQLVTMIVDDQLFGIPILQVQDIVEASKITPVPLAPSAIAGVLNLRGRIVTVIDLRKLLGNHEEVPWESQMGVTVDHKGDLYTLLVDAIGDVRTLPKHDFDKSPSTMEDNVRRLCSGIYRLRGNLLVVLDVARILHTDIIEATPMLTVEERRNRKSAAIADSDGGGARRHQLSALMTDLNAYESETEDVFGRGLDTGHDDIKARKRASRHRRPIAERWQEVLEEKARKTGHATYRMREPDEETVENARTEMAQEDAEWAARVVDPHSLPPDATDEAAPDTSADEPRLDLPPQDAPDPMGDAMPTYSDTPLPSDDAPAMPAEQPDAWVEGPDPGDPAPDVLAEDVTGEDKKPLDLAVNPEIPAAESAGETIKPAEAEATPDMPAEQAEPEPANVPQMDAPIEAPTDQPTAEATGSAPAADAEGPAASDVGGGGIASDWWNKLRARTGGRAPQPDTVEAPPADGRAGTSKPAGTKKKTATAKKSGSKAKRSSKSGGTSKAGAKTKKKKT